MGKFKKGDFVRVMDNKGAPYHFRVGDVHKVDAVLAGLVYVLGKPGMFAKRFEPWQPRVGERVRTISGGDIEYIGVEGVIEADDGATDRNLRVKLDKPIEKWGDTKIWRSARHLEPIISTATPENPATLKIEAGKFYKTRDGRKAKIERSHYCDSYDFVATVEGRSGNRVYKKNGKHGSRWIANNPSDDLVAEWIDEPVAKPSNDNAQPKFKVGDIVTPSHGWSKDCATVTQIKDGRVSVRWNNGAFGSEHGWREDELSPVLLRPTTTIVALIENGQPKPSSTPHVHASTGAAENEAKRLAAKYKGKQFGVFTLTTTHEEAAPVYDHKWQNMAALGLKIDAIKELQALAGIPRGHAARIVGQFAA